MSREAAGRRESDKQAATGRRGTSRLCGAVMGWRTTWALKGQNTQQLLETTRKEVADT